MKITVIYQGGGVVQYKVIEVHDTVWEAIANAGIYEGDVWYIFQGECVPL
jgi:hypothetical protein